MKKFISKLVSIAMSTTFILGVAVEGYYPEVGKIVKVDEKNDIVYVQTALGHVFSFYGIEDLYVGDLLGMLMKDNGTEIVYDDEIVDITYRGTPEDFINIGRTEETEVDFIIEGSLIEPEEIIIEDLEIPETMLELAELEKLF